MEFEYMYNIDEDEAIITIYDDGMCRVELESGFFRFFDNYDMATNKLEKMGYRF